MGQKTERPKSNYFYFITKTISSGYKLFFPLALWNHLLSSCFSFFFFDIHSCILFLFLFFSFLFAPPCINDNSRRPDPFAPSPPFKVISFQDCCPPVIRRGPGKIKKDEHRLFHIFPVNDISTKNPKAKTKNNQTKIKISCWRGDFTKSELLRKLPILTPSIRTEAV